jgi:hypothetical protein
MLFDYNPWAKLVQLNSTHPLTDRRIAHLGKGGFPCAMAILVIASALVYWLLKRSGTVGR